MKLYLSKSIYITKFKETLTEFEQKELEKHQSKIEKYKYILKLYQPGIRTVLNYLAYFQLHKLTKKLSNTKNINSIWDQLFNKHIIKPFIKIDYKYIRS